MDKKTQGIIGVLLLGIAGLYLVSSNESNKSGQVNVDNVASVKTVGIDRPVDVVESSEVLDVSSVGSRVEESRKESDSSVSAKDTQKVVVPEPKEPTVNDSTTTGEANREDENESTTPQKNDETVQENGVDLLSYAHVVSGAELAEIDIDIRTVVLVRCQYTTQYFGVSSQSADEIRFSFGSGSFVSSNGHVLTAGHVVRDLGPYEGELDRVWKFRKCQIARTAHDVLKAIKSQDPSSLGDETWFEDVDIIFQPSGAQYKDSNGLDVAILQVKENTSADAYAKLLPNMVDMEKDEYNIKAMGYPGKDVFSEQLLERYDAFLSEIISLKGSECIEGKLSVACGWRYAVARFLPDMQKQLNQRSVHGIFSHTTRGGFSGSPVFYKGNLIGIVTHSSEIKDPDVDMYHVLTSYDITEVLKKEGISF